MLSTRLLESAEKNGCHKFPETASNSITARIPHFC